MTVVYIMVFVYLNVKKKINIKGHSTVSQVLKGEASAGHYSHSCTAQSHLYTRTHILAVPYGVNYF